MTRILIVEDEPSTLNVLSTLLKTEGYDVTAVDNGNQAIQLLDTVQFDLMLSDIHMTPVDGMELLKRAHDRQPEMAVIMLTGYASVETAIQSLKLGAFDYVTKPFKVDELFVSVQKAIEAGATRSSEVGEPTQEHYRFENIVAASESMRQVCQMVERVAQTEVMVLILGEDGVGKSMIAKTIHVISKRRDKPFEHCNCTEMTEAILERTLFGAPAEGNRAAQAGAFEQAQGGTFYIEGIHAMPLSIQDRLLNVLQQKKIPTCDGDGSVPLNVRLITSSIMPLDALVEKGQLRQDLYYRLSALPIEIKPLRQRPEDILPLVFHSLRQIIGEGRRLPTITPEACAILQQYSWPGNVREMENVIKHALAFTKDTLGKEGLPPAMIKGLKQRATRIPGKTSKADAYRAKSLKAFLLREKEKKSIERALQNEGGDKQKVAQTLKISPADLEKKIDEHKLQT